MNDTTTRSYDPSYSRLSTEKDRLDNASTYQYDNSDRPTTVSSTFGNQNTTSYIWTGSNKPALGVYGVTQTGNDNSASTVWYDKLSRPIRSEKKGFNGQMILTDTEYNSMGQIYRISDPYFTGGSVVLAETYSAYDAYGRVTAIDRNTGQNTTYGYAANRVTETTDGKSSWKETDSQGLVTTAHDNGGDIVYTYFPDAKVKTITAPGGVVTTMQYNDAARNKTQLADPSSGTINYSYNSLGQNKTQTDARGRLTNYTYLPDGRTDNVVTPEGTTTYTYNTNNQITGISSPNSVSRTYGYDPQGRQTSISENIEGSVFTTTFTFDNLGRLSTRTHPSGIVETLNYTNGYMASVSAGGLTRYTITSMNVREQITGSTYGSNLTAINEFDAYGFPKSTSTGTIQDYRYSFNPVTGNLNSRQNFLKSKSESFTYDNLERLTGVAGPQNLTMTYNANGNINTKSDIGTTAFGYGTNAGPYALTGVTSSMGVIPSVSQAITYTSFESVSTIAEENYNATIIYNSDNERAKMDVTQSGSTILTRWYAGSSYMKETAAGVTKEYTYIGGDAYSAPIAAITQSGVTTYYYLLRDYLGNITHWVNTSNTVDAEYSFDAWGRSRNPTDWSYDLTGQPAMFADRGFTSHEYLPWFNLYNMNGRMYDPLVGRFISPDPYVQMPGQTQSMNRYTYCMNNPLLYVDYNGYTWFSKAKKWVSKNSKQIITIAATIVVVAVVTVVTAGVGTGPIVAAAIVGGAGGFTSGAMGSWLNGGSLLDCLGAGAINGAIGAVAGMAGGAAAGWVSKSVGSFAINSLQVAGKSAIGGALSGAIGGAAAGGAGGFVTGLATTGDLGKALEMAKQGAIFGGIAGAAVGGYQGFKAAKEAGNNPWTGKAAEAKVKYPSVGAQGRSVSLKKLDSNYLKKLGFDAEQIKYDEFGQGAPVSLYDLYSTPSGQIVILRKGGIGEPIWTDKVIIK